MELNNLKLVKIGGYGISLLVDIQDDKMVFYKQENYMRDSIVKISVEDAKNLFDSLNVNCNDMELVQQHMGWD